MPSFTYEARTQDGQLVGGMAKAANLEEAGQKLSAQGYYVVKLSPVDGGDASDAGEAEGGSRLRASRRSVMWFMNQLAIMVDTGITLSEALDVLSRQATEPAMREMLTDVSAAVQEGRPLSDALERFPRSFPNVSIAMIRASEHSGTLSLVLNRLAEYMLKDQQALSRLRGALIYPGFMFFMCISVTIFLLTVILPRFATIYATKNATLPAPTRVLMAMSGALVNHWAYILISVGAVVFGCRWYMKTRRGRAHRDWLQLNIPVIGPVFSKLFQSRSFRAIGTLLESGVGIGQVMQLARAMSSNTLYRQLWARIEEGITNGERITVQMVQSGLFPEQVTHMIDCGDRSGRLGFIFNKLAGFLEQEYDQAVGVASKFIEPLMILFMGGMIGFIAISMLLPMFKIATVVAK